MESQKLALDELVPTVEDYFDKPIKAEPDEVAEQVAEGVKSEKDEDKVDSETAYSELADEQEESVARLPPVVKLDVD